MSRLKQFASGLGVGVRASRSASDHAGTGPSEAAAQGGKSRSDYLRGALLLALAAIGVFRFGRREGIALHVALMLGFCFFFGLWFLARGRWMHGVWFRVVAWGLFVASLVAEVAATSNPNWSLILFAVIAGLLFACEFYEAARRSA